jgi:hypothetical protein
MPEALPHGRQLHSRIKYFQGSYTGQYARAMDAAKEVEPDSEDGAFYAGMAAAYFRILRDLDVLLAGPLEGPLLQGQLRETIQRWRAAHDMWSRAKYSTYADTKWNQHYAQTLGFEYRCCADQLSYLLEAKYA